MIRKTSWTKYSAIKPKKMSRIFISELVFREERI